MITDLQVAWLAGLLEGEGSFMICDRTRSVSSPKIVVSMTDRDVIEHVANLFGRAVYTMPTRQGYKQQWRVQVDGFAAASWMARLRSFMGDRRTAKIDEVLGGYLDFYRPSATMDSYTPAQAAAAMDEEEE
jgi:hypothetical protein